MGIDSTSGSSNSGGTENFPVNPYLKKTDNDPIPPFPTLDNLKATFDAFIKSCKGKEMNFELLMIMFMQVAGYYSGQMDYESGSVDKVSKLQGYENDAEGVYAKARDFDPSTGTGGINQHDATRFVNDNKSEWTYITSLHNNKLITDEQYTQMQDSFQKRMDTATGYYDDNTQPRIVFNSDGTTTGACPPADIAAKMNTMWALSKGSATTPPNPTALTDVQNMQDAGTEITQTISGGLSQKVQALLKYLSDTQNTWLTAGDKSGKALMDSLTAIIANLRPTS